METTIVNADCRAGKLKEISSPLRYPGGKSRALKQILPLCHDFDEFREPFVGGGSVFVSLKQLKRTAAFWINDLNPDLYFFWKFAKSDLDRFVAEVSRIKRDTENGRELFESYRNNWDKIDDFSRAVRFFVLNRITFSGTIDSGGYSKQSFRDRFTLSSIERLSKLSLVLDGVKITNTDYEEVVKYPGENVFIFLDPPYYSTTASRLYGKNGNLHSSFDHVRFAENMKNCHHKWLITYDDCPEIRKLFDFANILPWSVQYGMNNYKQNTARVGKELFISNYSIESSPKAQLAQICH